MAEAVRLVIWDLDETFWHGTVTEGGHRYNQAAHDTVIELARRGIMSSICSKNDYAAVARILQDADIWQYFIFPSINWDPKGPRIAALVETVQLRPETILFIDDNPSNLNEARHFVPELQTADETFVPDLLADPRFKGKDDARLERLAQYKVLERRKADEAVAVQEAGSNRGFLRASHIRVRIERDIDRHIDRAIELINRTNQLNFTKTRLPENPQEARLALRAQLDSHMVQAGLIEVTDDYGKYGYCGFYQTRAAPDGSRLQHFCFSCRILDMGVEAWTYQMLGRPLLKIRGRALSDPIAADTVDWITLVADAPVADAPVADAPVAAADATAALPGPAMDRRSSVAARGGCVLTPLLHYFAATASRTIGEYNTVRAGNVIRLDHSLCFRHALDGLAPDQLAAARLIGYEDADFQSAFFDHEGPSPIWIFSNWADLGCPIYKHRETGLRVPYKPPPDRPVKPPAILLAEANLAAHFEPDDFLGEAEMKENLHAVFSRVPAHGSMFVLLAIDNFTKNGIWRKIKKRLLQNQWTVDVAREYPRVTVLDMADFIENAGDVKEGPGAGHFDRMVYYRVYRRIQGLVQGTALAA